MQQTIFRKAFNRLVTAREIQARRLVESHLRSLDDDTLRALGHRRDEFATKPGTSSLF